MTRLITIAAAFAGFVENIKPAVVEQYGEDDSVAMSEAWNDYTDSLCKDGALTNLQYHHCPAYGGSMPDDDFDSELEFLLGEMGVTIVSRKVDSRPDGFMSDMPAGSSHYLVTITRGNKDPLEAYYSQGQDDFDPNDFDVLNAFLMDLTDNTEGEFVESEFADWANNLGWDSDSRKALAAYTACLATTKTLRGLFTGSELDDLRELLDAR